MRKMRFSFVDSNVETGELETGWHVDCFAQVAPLAPVKTPAVPTVLYLDRDISWQR